MYYILNHYSRDASKIIDALATQGVTPQLFTDESNYYQLPKKHISRYKGVQKNYRNILEAETSDKWKIIMHDDVSISENLVEKVEHILQFAPQGLVSFYLPTNLQYKKLSQSGKHVLRTYNNYWVQFHAIPTDLAERFSKWCNDNVNPVGYLAEDGLIKSFTSHTATPVFSIFPSLIQHEGYSESVFANPARTGKYFRYSEFYRPAFDVYSVDWKKEFANPYPEDSKRSTSFGLHGRLPMNVRYDDDAGI